MTSFCAHGQFMQLHFFKTNGSYVNQEYSVRGESSTFKYTCLFAVSCDLFSHYSGTKIAASVIGQFSVSEEKSSCHEQVLLNTDK